MRVRVRSLTLRVRVRSVSVVLSCQEVFGFAVNNLWVLSRVPDLDNATYTNVLARAEASGIPVSKMSITKTYQGSDCEY